MDWLWKVLVAGYLATGTCGAPLVDEKPPEAPPADTTKPPAPTPPKPPEPKPPEPKPPEPTYSWAKVSVPWYADGTFRKIVGKPRKLNEPYEVALLSKGSNNFSLQVANKDLSGKIVRLDYNWNAPYEIFDINYTDSGVLENAGTTKDGLLGFIPIKDGRGGLQFTSACMYSPGPTPPMYKKTGKFFAVHNNVAVGEVGGFLVNDRDLCRIFTLKYFGDKNPVWLDNNLIGVWTGKMKQFFIGSTSTRSGNFIAITIRPFSWAVTTDVSLDDKNGAGLNAIWGISDTNVIAVGNDSTVLQYDGTKWNDIAIPSELGTIDLTSVYATPDGDYVIGGEGGVVLVYKGGAFTIHRLPVTDKVISVHAWSSSDIYALTDNALYRFYLH